MFGTDKVVVAQAFADSVDDQRGHLIRCVKFAGVVPARELVHVPLEVLFAELVIRAVVSALEHRPEGFDAVRVRLTAHILFDAVLDRLVLAVDADVGLRFVRIDSGICVGVGAHERLERSPVSGFDCFGYDVPALALFDRHYRRFAHRAASRIEFLGLMLVALFTADIRFVHFHFPAERSRVGVPSLADAVKHVPCGLLSHVDVAVQLHGRYALEVR